MIKQLRILFAIVGLASAQSWTDPAGVCEKAESVEEGSRDVKVATVYYPKSESISLDDPSLQDMVFEFDETAKEGQGKNIAKCFYFTTQVIPGQKVQQSPRYCPEDSDKQDGDDGKFTQKQSIPLWNVAKITTKIQGTQITDMSFHMRYTNVSDPTGYYKWDDAAKTLIDNAIADGSLQSAEGVDATNLLINNKEPQILSRNDDGSFSWAEPTWGDLINIDGSYLQKHWNVSMIKYDDIIAVKTFQVSASDDPQAGCKIDILPGSTVKGAKFFQERGNFLNTISFRLQPKVEYYDTTHSYSQNGDIYTVGYDNDFYDGKIEYTANGYPPQSVSWKLSRSLSTTVVTSALAIAGALLGSMAF